MHKNFKTIFILSNLLFFLPAFQHSLKAQTDTISIKEIEITSSRIPTVYSESSRIVNIITKEQIENAAVNDIHDLLKFVAGVDCRQRGVDGVQSDISIRGGTFDQVLVLLNGIPMNDPQTGHHTLNLPIDIQNIQKIEVLEGPGCRIYGPNAFSGAINIITGNDLDKKLVFSLNGGEHNLFGGFLSYSNQIRNLHNYISFSKKVCDGFQHNTDYDISQFFYQSDLKFKKADLGFMAGYLDKAYGANSFYSSKYPDQYEYLKTAFLGLKLTTKGIVDGMYNIYWRRNQDRFELFRGNENAPSWYTSHNYHMTNTMGGNFNYSLKSKLGKTAFGGEFRNESIISNVLGTNLKDTTPVPGESNALYTKGADRQNVSLFAEQSYMIRKLTISGGLLVNWNSDFDWKVYPGMDLDLLISKKIKLIASVNESMRMPTYTDLYYSSATNIGNSDLKPESSVTYETGCKYLGNALDVKIAFFRREGKNLIDWVKYPDSTKWESKNITKINTNGAEAIAFIDLIKLTKNKNFYLNYISFSYSFLDATKLKNEYVSKYVMDYLVHKADLNLKHKIYKSIFAVWNISYQDRNGTYIDYNSQLETAYKPVLLINPKLIWQYRFLQTYVEASNLIGEEYYDYGNVLMPGRWISGGIKLNLDLNKEK